MQPLGLINAGKVIEAAVDSATTVAKTCEDPASVIFDALFDVAAMPLATPPVKPAAPSSIEAPRITETEGNQSPDTATSEMVAALATSLDIVLKGVSPRAPVENIRITIDVPQPVAHVREDGPEPSTLAGQEPAPDFAETHMMFVHPEACLASTAPLMPGDDRETVGAEDAPPAPALTPAAETSSKAGLCFAKPEVAGAPKDEGGEELSAPVPDQLSRTADFRPETPVDGKIGHVRTVSAQLTRPDSKERDATVSKSRRDPVGAHGGTLASGPDSLEEGVAVAPATDGHKSSRANRQKLNAEGTKATAPDAQRKEQASNLKSTFPDRQPLLRKASIHPAENHSVSDSIDADHTASMVEDEEVTGEAIRATAQATTRTPNPSEPFISLASHDLTVERPRSRVAQDEHRPEEPRRAQNAMVPMLPHDVTNTFHETQQPGRGREITPILRDAWAEADPSNEQDPTARIPAPAPRVRSMTQGHEKIVAENARDGAATSSTNIRDLIKLGADNIDSAGQKGPGEKVAMLQDAPLAPIETLSAAPRDRQVDTLVRDSSDSGSAERRAEAAEMRLRAIERQVVASAREGVDTVRLQLYPPGLGQVIIRLSLDGSRLRLSTRTTNSDATEALRLVETELRDALAGNGLELTAFDVSEDASDGGERRKQAENVTRKTRGAKSEDFAIDMNA